MGTGGAGTSSTVTQEHGRAGGETERVTHAVAPDDTGAGASRLRSERIWRVLNRASFAVLSYATPAGETRSSGVVYATVGRRLYVAVSPDSWKARHIASGGQVAVTVPVRRGGILSLIFPIPPATINFHGRAIVHPAGAGMDPVLSKALGPSLPPERRTAACIIEIPPEGHFLTYGLGVSLLQMRSPAAARARVPVS
jgi:hypothetical protein